MLSFIQGHLATGRRALLERHLGSCERCADLATWAAGGFAATNPRRPGEGWPIAGRLAAGARVGRYHILGLIGRGGMGEVYGAYDPDLDRRIALKILYGPRAADPDR